MSYAILRSIPNKLGGVIALVLSILVLIVCPFTHAGRFRRAIFYPLSRVYFWAHIRVVGLLTWVGARPVEDPYVVIGQLLSGLYFVYYMLAPYLMAA